MRITDYCCNITNFIKCSPVSGEIKVIDVAMVITRHKPVTNYTKGHFCELHVLALSCQPSLNVGYLAKKPAAGKIL